MAIDTVNTIESVLNISETNFLCIPMIYDNAK